MKTNIINDNVLAVSSDINDFMKGAEGWGQFRTHEVAIGSLIQSLFILNSIARDRDAVRGLVDEIYDLVADGTEFVEGAINEANKIDKDVDFGRGGSA